MSVYSAIKSLIKQKGSKGSIFVDEMMRYALSSSPDSYYQTQDQLGALGDFTTSPEISQLFGEIIALWVIERWYQMGCPGETNLVELGAGRGTLMRDILHVAKLVPEFYRSLVVELLEINPYFIAEQQAQLQEFCATNTLRHLPQIQHMAKLPSIIIANEFFDAVPIKQYIKNKDGWYEVTVNINFSDDQLQFDRTLINQALQDHLLQKHPNAPYGAIIEESPEASSITRFISQHLSSYGGAALIIDYGYDINPEQRTGAQYTPTLQAVIKHQYCPILENLGKADLSAHVDFFALKTIAKTRNIEVSDILTQRDFLINYGILQRAQLLRNKLPMSEANIISRQVDRLIAPDKMGILFKVLCILSKN